MKMQHTGSSHVAVINNRHLSSQTLAVHDGVDFTSMYRYINFNDVCVCQIILIAVQFYSYISVFFSHWIIGRFVISILLLFLCSCLSLNSNFRVNCLCVVLHLSCIFMACNLVLHFHVLHFHSVQFGPSFSRNPYSCRASPQQNPRLLKEIITLRQMCVSYYL